MCANCAADTLQARNSKKCRTAFLPSTPEFSERWLCCASSPEICSLCTAPPSSSIFPRRDLDARDVDADRLPPRFFDSRSWGRVCADASHCSNGAVPVSGEWDFHLAAHCRRQLTASGLPNASAFGQLVGADALCLSPFQRTSHSRSRWPVTCVDPRRNSAPRPALGGHKTRVSRVYDVGMGIEPMVPCGE